MVEINYQGADAAEVMQESVSEPPEIVMVPVRVDGMVNTHSLPAVTSSIHHFTLDATTPIRILDGDPRRSQAHIMTDADLYVGTTDAQVRDASQRGTMQFGTTESGIVWPSRERLYAMATTGTVEVTVINHQFAL